MPEIHWTLTGYAIKSETMKAGYWTPLKKGDIVDVILPAGRPRPRTMGGIQSFLKSWGLKARISADSLGPDLICANSKEIRFKNLKKAILAKDSSMIWCVRGGYGAIHLLEALDKLKPQKTKCFLGYSDITSLHTFLNQKWGWATIHGPNIDRFALRTGSAAEAKRIHDMIFGKNMSQTFKLKPLNKPAMTSKTLKGRVVGGNLITLQSSFGTKFSIHTAGEILFLEDIGERAYRVDRVFEHMKQLGLFKNLRALVLGQFTGGQEPDGKNLLPQYFKQFASEQKFPVLHGMPCGHGPNQVPLPLGTSSKLYLGKSPVLEVSSGVRVR